MLVNKKIEAHTNTTNRHKRDTSVGSRQIFDEASFFCESWNNRGDRLKHIIFWAAQQACIRALSFSYLSLAGRPHKFSKHNDKPQQEMGHKLPRNPRLHWTSKENMWSSREKKTSSFFSLAFAFFYSTENKPFFYSAENKPYSLFSVE